MEIKKNNDNSNYYNIQIENQKYFQNIEKDQNINSKKDNDFKTLFSSNCFSKNINDLEEKEKIKFKANIINNSNINEKDLLSEKKDNLFNTASTFFVKDYLFNENSNRDNNQNNLNSFSSINYNNLNKNYNVNKNQKNNLDLKYNYYLENLNRERNDGNVKYIQENGNIQKLLEEEKNIEEENIKRLSELRVKYLSSIKTFELPIEEFHALNNNNNINNNVQNLKATSERMDFMNNNDKNDYKNNNNNDLNNKNSSFSLCNKLFNHANSFNDIIHSPNNLTYNKGISLFNLEKNLTPNNYSNYISNIIPNKHVENEYNNKNSNELKQNKIINKIGSISKYSLNEELETIGKKSEFENENDIPYNPREIKNDIIHNKENEIKKDLKKSNLNSSYNINNKKNYKNENINMSIYGRNHENNNIKFLNTDQNIQSNNDNDNDFYFKYDESFDEKHKIMGKGNNLKNIESKEYEEIMERNKNEYNNNIFKEKNFDNLNLKTNKSQKEQNIEGLIEKSYLNAHNNMNENSEKKNINENNDEFVKNLELKYNNLLFEYNSLKYNYIQLLDNYNKEKNKRNIEDEKNLFNEYILKENNNLRIVNSNYQFIVTPLINYINDVNYLINKKTLKKIDIATINQKIRNTNENTSIEEHPLNSFIELLDSYKNIILNDEFIHSINRKSKSNPKKLNSYESIMKNYNIKNNIVFKSKNNNTKESFSKSIGLTPIYSKNIKNKFLRNKNTKTEKYHNKSRGKIVEKRKKIVGKILKKGNSSDKYIKSN